MLIFHIFKVTWYPPDWFLYWIFSDWCQCVPTEMEPDRDEFEEISWTGGELIQRLKETNPSSFDHWSSFHGWISKINCHKWSQQKQTRKPEGQHRSLWVWRLGVVTVREGGMGWHLWDWKKVLSLLALCQVGGGDSWLPRTLSLRTSLDDVIINVSRIIAIINHNWTP